MGKSGRHRVVILGVAGALLLAVGDAFAVSAEQPRPTAQPLWDAFPLDQAGQLANRSKPVERPTQRSTARRDAAPHAPSADARSRARIVALVGIAGVLALLTGGLLASARSMSSTSGPRRRSPTSRRKPSAYISAVFVGERRLPVIEARPGKKRMVRRRRYR